MAGTLVADGNRSITGTVDVISPDAVVGVSSNQPISAGSYVVGVDGRGQATFTTTIASGPATFTLDFVLTSSAHGLVTEFDSNGSGSGTLDKQASVVSQTNLTGLTFGLAGVGSTASFATVGSVALDSSGNVTSGFEDFNNGGTASTNQAVSTSSLVTLGIGTAPGKAQLSTSFGTFAFDVYAVDTTHLKFIETDSQFFLSGDGFAPGTSIPTGTLVFSMAGADTSNLPLASAGFMPTNASGAITAGTEDFNDDGVTDPSPVSFSGNFAPFVGGRSVLSLANFVNGNPNLTVGNYLFAAYPFNSNGVTGVFLLDIDGLGATSVTSGVAYLQTGTTLAASSGYGMNLSAFNLGNGTGMFEEDDIAEFTSTSNTLNGLVDFSDEGNFTFKQPFTGNYTPGVTGQYIATTTNAFNFNIYVVNSATFLTLETDQNQIGTGIFELQNASGSPGAQPGISMVRTAAQAHAARRRPK
jgi:hypothetical protein